MSAPRRTRGVFGLATKNIPALLALAHNVQVKMSADPQHFPSPTPSTADLLALIQSVESAQPAVLSRTKGAAAARNSKAKALIGALEQEQKYVQIVADGLPEDDAIAVVHAAGFKVATVEPHVKPPLTLTNGTPSGTVIARAFAALLAGGRSKRCLFNWQFSNDGGATWVTAPPTVTAMTQFSGFARLTTVAARVAFTVGKQPIGEWSQVVTVLVT